LNAPIWATLRDVSASGCYVQSANVAARGEVLYGQFTINNTQVNAIVQVRSSVHAVGMGLLWCDLGAGGQAKLTRILRELACDSGDEVGGRAEALSHLNRVHQLLVAVRERLEVDTVVVNANTISQLSEAQEKLTAALRSVQP
jgi:hypothetical protein